MSLKTLRGGDMIWQVALCLAGKMKLALLLFRLLASVVHCAVTGPLTYHFQSWLIENGYGSYNFVRLDYGTQGSYGGKANSSEQIRRTPVTFIHGNSDSALSTSNYWNSTGWSASIEYFLQNGFTRAELYATSWGDNNNMLSGNRSHSCDHLLRLRRFVEAVKNYTGADKMSIVSHSMGVTLSRKVINGGDVQATPTCNLGVSLAPSVEVLVGTASANYGLCECQYVQSVNTCNHKVEESTRPLSSVISTLSFSKVSSLVPIAVSEHRLHAFAHAIHMRFAHLFPVFDGSEQRSEGDQVCVQHVEYSRRSDFGGRHGVGTTHQSHSEEPKSNAKMIFTNYTHMESKDRTASLQFDAIFNHKLQ